MSETENNECANKFQKLTLFYVFLLNQFELETDQTINWFHVVKIVLWYTENIKEMFLKLLKLISKLIWKLLLEA